MENKQCTKCGRTKPLGDFYHRDGKPLSRCKECVKAEVRKNRLDNLDKRKKADKDRRDRDLEKARASQRASYFRNREKRLEERRAYYRDNREAASQVNKNWRVNNRARYNVIKSRRRAAQKSAVPPWLSDKQWQDIEFFYWFADSIRGLHGENYQVDHIHPLQGGNFSGLHVPWNLQVIPASANAGKCNNPPKEELDLFFDLTKEEVSAYLGGY